MLSSHRWELSVSAGLTLQTATHSDKSYLAKFLDRTHPAQSSWCWRLAMLVEGGPLGANC